MDMSSLANVRSITRAPGAVVTYDELGNKVITNASIKNGNGTPVAAYSLIKGTTPYNPNNAYRDTIKKWAKARKSGNPNSGYNAELIRELMKLMGYEVDGLTNDELMNLYAGEIRKNSFDMNYLNGRVTGRASSRDHTLYGRGASPESMARNPNVSSSVTRHFDADGRRIALR